MRRGRRQRIRILFEMKIENSKMRLRVRMKESRKFYLGWPEETCASACEEERNLLDSRGPSEAMVFGAELL